MAQTFDRPHFAHPFGRDSTGSPALVEQDTPEDVTGCETRIVLCPLGFRLDRPEFGWPWPMFQTMPLDLTALDNALDRFEPRGEGTAVGYLDLMNFGEEDIDVFVGVNQTTGGIS
jgi:hypothetical protein